ncbi:uncharacterized protein LOC125655751 [Ostrea edulis]|uniref:uncharacterized protein LOC125655751 n=1 Tax=Ostrea edulis TaxID=37623 RepID=UPI0024AEDE3A|nr:uncharacterized protein LOC125655751 [Ostrea edulis]
MKLLTKPVLQNFVTVANVSRGINHISRVTSDLIWVNDERNLVLTDTTGAVLRELRGIFISGLFRGYGVHTVNSAGELIYISKQYDVIKVSTDNTTHTTLLRKSTTWDPISVYSSPSTGDIFIGLWNNGNIGKVVRYNIDTEKIVQVIQYKSTRQVMYGCPIYITENGNGDVIVSDYGRAVVVTDDKGKYRFSYTGLSSLFCPRGICTDVYLHILVCDDITNSVQILNKDGCFLSLLPMVNKARSLSYDTETQFVMVGSRYSNSVSVYRYIEKKDCLTECVESEDQDEIIPQTLHQNDEEYTQKFLSEKENACISMEKEDGQTEVSEVRDKKPLHEVECAECVESEDQIERIPQTLHQNDEEYTQTFLSEKERACISMEKEDGPTEVSEVQDEKIPQPRHENDGESKQKHLSEKEDGQDEVFDVSLSQWDPKNILNNLYAVKLMPDEAKDKIEQFVVMEGLMEKLPMNTKSPTNFKTWKQRFFRAKYGWLYYYESSYHNKPSDALQLMGGQVEELVDRTLVIKDRSGRYLKVRCSTDKEYRRWKMALQSHTTYNIKATYVKPVLSCIQHPKKKVIVIDIGSGSIRAGILGKEATLPTLFFPNIVLRAEDDQAVVGFEAFHPKYRNLLFKSAITMTRVNKCSIDLYTIGAVFRKVFSDFKVEPADYWLMISTPQNLEDTIRAGLMRILMGRHHVQGVCMVRQSLLALYSYNATSGIIVDIGERMEILPIYDVPLIEGGTSKQCYGGQKVIESLSACLHDSVLSTPIHDLILRYIMEQSCYLVTDYKDAMRKCEQDLEHYKTTVYLNNFDLPEGAALEVTHDYSCFKSPEGFFNTDLWGMDYPCVHTLVFQAIQSCRKDIRNSMYRAVYLSGGVTMLPGFAERLQGELQSLAPPNVMVEVHSSPQRYHGAFIGACKFASMEQFQHICISAEEWNKDGTKTFKRSWNMIG